VPAALRALHDRSAALDAVAAREAHDSLLPLFGLACLTAEEPVELGGERVLVPQRSRGAATVKTALAMLGVLPPVWRAPLGPMGAAGQARVAAALRQMGRGSPRWLAPLSEAFGADLVARLEAGPALMLAAGGAS
jgi:dihydrodipicolinate synthase/N-acetylneuraminate lyase